MGDRLIIFDTTLRDGEQSPGASMTKDEKLRIARQLERLRVDVIEAGFAASSNGDFEAVRSIADHIKESTVCSLVGHEPSFFTVAPAVYGRANARSATASIEAKRGHFIVVFPSSGAGERRRPRPARAGRPWSR